MHSIRLDGTRQRGIYPTKRDTYAEELPKVVFHQEGADLGRILYFDISE